MRMLPPLVVVFTGLAMVACGNGGADRGSPAGHETIPRPPPPQSGAETPPEDKAAEAPAASWVQVTAGTFQMGSPAAEGCRENGETRHEVTLSQAFEIQSTEVTQGQFADRMGYNPSHFHACGLDCPVETVTWHEAAAYCNALSAAAGLASCYTCSGSGKEAACTDTERHAGAEIYSCPGYRLPTDAEWEYGYRAGTSTALHSGDVGACSGVADPGANEIGWYECNSGVTYDPCFDGSEFSCGAACMGTHPVGEKAPNGWGIYDMTGNVWEWCHDRYQEDLGRDAVVDPWGAASGEERLLRGGAFDSTATRLRAAVRDPGHPSEALDFCKGFRCVRTR